MPGALNRITVVDFTEYIAGPYCTMMLADMGARVIKIEKPEGDAWRHTAPVAPYEARGFLGVNRGKESIALDMGKPEGLAIAQRLARAADVVTTNYRPGVGKRLALDYESLSVDNPGLIYCENSAFGNKGPYAGRPGFDILSQAATGMILYENKIEKGLPTYIATLAVADLTTGMFMAFAIVNALYARLTSGKGQHIETTLFASGLAAQYRPLLSVEEIDRPVREGFLQELAETLKGGFHFDEVSKLRHSYIPARGRNNYYRIYETNDGLIAVACLNNRQRRALRDTLGVEDPTVDGMSYDWFSEDVRKAHQATIEQFEGTFRTRGTGVWLSALDAADVPCNRVAFPEEVFDDPHAVANEHIITLDHSVLGPLRMPAPPMRMSGTPAEARSAPPALGEHGPSVLRELGYSDTDVERLLAQGALFTRDRLVAE
jgi:formyl-CoA transferase